MIVKDQQLNFKNKIYLTKQTMTFYLSLKKITNTRVPNKIFRKG